MSDVNNEEVEFGKEPAGKDNKKTIAIIGGAVVAVVAVILILVSLLGGGYKKPIKNYFRGMEKADAKSFIKAYPSFMKDNLEDTYDEDAMEAMKKSYEKSYGDKIKISYKILDKTKIDKDDLKDVEDDLEDEYEDEKVKVTAGYKVCVKGTIKGSDDKNTSYRTMEIYKVNGKWCIID